MSEDRENTLLRLATALTDGQPVDWDTEARDVPADRLEQFRLLQAIATRSGAAPTHPAAAVPDAVSPRTWGSLQLLQRLHSLCTGGEVYRAFDPALQREVALKLRPVGSLPVDEFLREARSLARVRHPNVLTVHGAGLWDERVGLWTDFVQGKNLATYLEEHGALGAREAAVIGTDLCRALAAVHAAGLVHGDIKVANVIREDGGRIVLLDFGSTAASDSSLGAVHGSPMFMAPELFQGALPTPATDLYSLGATLFQLVTGRLPFETDTLASLVQKKSRGEMLRLRDLRSDLPTAFVHVIERALAPAPADRFTSAAEMETALATAAELGSTSKPRLHRWLLGLGVAMVAVTAVLGIARSRSPLAVEATLYREEPTADVALGPGESVRLGDRLFLEIESSRAAYFYVLNEDAEGNAYLLFPLPEFEPHNPLPAGERLRLPGQQNGAARTWQIDSSNGRETLLVVAAHEPIADLEGGSHDFALPATGDAEPVQLRGLGRVASGRGAATAPRPGTLDAFARTLAQDRAPRIWMQRFELQNP
jgi:serine/threonine protein kinase